MKIAEPLGGRAATSRPSSRPARRIGRPARASLVAGLLTLCAPSALRAESRLLVVSPAMPIILGEVDSVALVIESPELPDTEGRPLQAAVNVGRLDPPELVGPGKYKTTYYPPSTKFPQAAIIAVWRETGPDAEVDFLRIPLSARTKFPVQAKPGAEVRIFIDGERFGPVTADRKGTAAVPLIVPPGTREVEVEVASGIDRKKSTVAIKVPPYNRLAAAVVPHLLTQGVAASVYVYYDGAKPPTIDDIKPSATGADIRGLGGIGVGRYRFKLTPNGSSPEVKASFSIVGDDISSAQVTAPLGAPTAEKILNRTAPTSLSANGSSTKVIRVLVTDRQGLGVPNLELGATASEGVVGRPKDVGQGHYEVVLTAPAAVPANGKVTVGIAARVGTGEPLTLTVDTPITGGVRSQPMASASTSRDSSAPAKALTLAARFGGTYDAQLGLAAGVEVGFRPAILDRRLAFVVNASFRRLSRDFTADGLAGVESAVTRLPITGGFTYDFLVKNQLRLYAGALGGGSGVAHRVTTTLQEPTTYKRIVPTAEALVGLSWMGAFVEVGGILMPISDRALKMPSIGAQASLGYRLGLF